ncbi:hypothetical protein A3J20_03230 [Candidatus Gottesmanbacteria bacterium RIFCSPLOWO2_02_FULL_42_29]|uniref:Cytidyltransferase-like domain-containing protein n=2 Tax=Candidatus Gottesmaniibacteriota TaxID=1752720 RepID=A0A1F6B7Q5_9BACT|nr:MAG: Bifunctional protein HldE [Candidatus Gottesmanbacteria bacterium GW2011_GWA2_42_18]KKS74333.1 MAG: Bifunctional protein HldE [Candidatus Gottesmanbacteria bacterium GW2011_GWC2_42_8]OGG11008.1 MAG: hypothetical protein A2781_04080 [Candidatus Gottesmanbacteria bacterium RIFCSPHIGHO2_01_FULL_42_27]OGG22672.1 MAG: hypothetical protein A3E72_03530 [Candidatus Gottesmanbacteria bacterium RIFCSPHIGHO2_12_FULL_43_26]OGG32969.1 MAG: hypothetical protein A2968_06915 [Candidatus Gottesmanbacter
MKKIVTINQAVRIAKVLHLRGKNITLIGGCFDILHIGHIKFIREAEKLGGKLFIFLEPDEKVSLLKGNERPVFSQKERAEMLSSLISVAYIIKLPVLKNNADYDDLIKKLQPDVIAVTDNDPLIALKKNQAEKNGGKLIVLPFHKSLSSSKIAEILKEEHL